MDFVTRMTTGGAEVWEKEVLYKLREKWIWGEEGVSSEELVGLAPGVEESVGFVWEMSQARMLERSGNRFRLTGAGAELAKIVNGWDLQGGGA